VLHLCSDHVRGKVEIVKGEIIYSEGQGKRQPSSQRKRFSCKQSSEVKCLNEEKKFKTNEAGNLKGQIYLGTTGLLHRLLMS